VAEVAQSLASFYFIAKASAFVDIKFGHPTPQTTVVLLLASNDPMTDKAILHAYRHLYRNALRATHHSSPAKHVIRETIRTAFRTESAAHFNPQRVKNTEDFLKRAERDTGMEHRILKNLLHVRYWQHHAKRDNRLYVRMQERIKWEADDDNRINLQTDMASQIRKENWAQYDATLALFNNSLDLCLR
jgi:hypothetical protein